MKTSAFMVGFVGLKGGVTKSTLCSLIATKFWHDYPEFKISVWDLDNQLSLYYQRSRDLYLIKHLPDKLKKVRDLKNMFYAAEKKSPMYPIRPYFEGTDEQYKALMSNPDNPIDYFRIKDMEEMDNMSKDMILVDFPGTIKYSDEMKALLVRLNALIIPVSFDARKDISSQKQYCDVIENLMAEQRCNFEGNVHIVWNRADKTIYQKKPGETTEESVNRVRNNIREIQDSAKFQFPSFNTIIPESKKIKDDLLQTVIPLTNDNVAANSITGLCHEFLNKVLK